MMWFLVSIVTGMYVGPLPEQKCKAAEDTPSGTFCRPSKAVLVCDVAGRPGTYMTCPVFEDLPQVTIKPENLPR